MTQDKTAQQLKLDARNHVEKPLLDQPVGLGFARYSRKIS